MSQSRRTILRLAFSGAFSGFALAGCGARLAKDARLPRPERIYVEDFHAPPATAVVDTNQFSYVMEGLDMPRDAHSRAADAAAAQVAVRETLLAELHALGFDARPGPPSRFAGNALIITGSITNIVEAVPSQLATLEIGAPASQVNARSTLLYQFAGRAPRVWRDFVANAPVVPDPNAPTPADATGVHYMPAQSADIRTREVAIQAHRLALRLAADLRDSFRAESWIAAASPPRD